MGRSLQAAFVVGAAVVATFTARAAALADPTDLQANLTTEDDLLDDGYPDTAKIETAARALVATKPNLADRRPTGDVGQGAREEPSVVNLADMLWTRAG